MEFERLYKSETQQKMYFFASLCFASCHADWVCPWKAVRILPGLPCRREEKLPCPHSWHRSRTHLMHIMGDNGWKDAFKLGSTQHILHEVNGVKAWHLFLWLLQDDFGDINGLQSWFWCDCTPNVLHVHLCFFFLGIFRTGNTLNGLTGATSTALLYLIYTWVYDALV